jgi:Sulfotransferase domain
VLAGAKRAIVALPYVGEPIRFANRAVRDPRGVRSERGFRSSFLLNSMRKSGTHYLMSMIANYLWFAFADGAERLDYVQMEQTIWNAKPPTETLARLELATGYTSWWTRHDAPLIWFNNARTIIHTYRNPLDSLVARYHFFSVNRAVPIYTSLDDALPQETEAFIGEYLPARALATRPNVLRISYEKLVREPAATLEAILDRAGIPCADNVLSRALDAGRPEYVARDEKRYDGPGNLVSSDMTTSFIRSGAIGEWKTVLGDEQVWRVKQMLGRHRISLDEFVLD